MLSACHPALRLRWFGPPNSIDYQRAKTLFDHIFNEYAQRIPSGSNGTSPVKARKEVPTNSDFLQSLMEDDEPLDFTGSTRYSTPEGVPVQNEMDRYLAGDGGRGDPQIPLAWWKVSWLCFMK